jgi:demethylmenaquinone methyltransferase/2-methoxy-6-polyprenyl-1,4-benzoquinol methylase
MNEKRNIINIFDAIASKYDMMNDILSFGIHRIWKCITINIGNTQQEQLILDLAGGSGDLTLLLAKKRKQKNKVILVDINKKMLGIAARRISNKHHQNINLVQADAEYLPFDENLFDCIFISFGLRNLLNKQLALQNMYRVLKKGGKLVILEFSMPTNFLYRKLYFLYLFIIVPFLGKIICGDNKGYLYLSNSIYTHPMQEELKSIIENVGYVICYYRNLLGGIAAIHVGFK